MDNGQEHLHRPPRTDEYYTLPEAWEIARRYNLGPGGGCAMETYIFLKEQGIVDLPEFIGALDAAQARNDFFRFGKSCIAWMKEAYEKMLKELPPGDGCAKQREHLMERVNTAVDRNRLADKFHRSGHTYWKENDTMMVPTHGDMPNWYRRLEEDCDYNFRKMMQKTESYAGRPGEALNEARIRSERERACGEVAGIVQS